MTYFNKVLSKQSGFTLLEILIAVAILSIIAMIMVRGLQVTMKTKERVEIASDKIAALQTAMSLMQQDLTQIVNRPIINNQNQTEAAVKFSNEAPVTLSFTRSGYANPGAVLQRSTLQRIDYVWQDNQLQRMSWPVLDRTQSTESTTRVLLNNVEKIQWRFLDNNNRFYNYWPANGQTLPKGVEIQFILTGGADITQLFLLTSSDIKQNQNSSQNQQGRQ